MHTATSNSARVAASLLACAALAAAPAAALAQETERSWDLGIALGHGERSNPLISGDSIDINAVLDFSWYGEHVFFDNGDLGYTLVEERNWSLSAIATINNERYYYNYLSGQDFGLDSLLGNRFAGLAGSSAGFGTMAKPEVDGPESPDAANELPPDLESLNRHTELPDRDFALNGGFEVLYISPWGDVQAQVLSDVSSTHEGQEAWLSWSKPWYTRSNEFTLTLGVEWKSANLVSYYYGVSADESFPGRDAYAAGSGANTFVRFAARHAFSPHWHLVGMVEREYLSSAISASPIVDRSAVDTFFAGLFYQF